MKLRFLLVLATAALVAVGAVACGDDDDGDDDDTGTPVASATAAGNATQAPDALKAALIESINEEYKAHATYQAVIDKFGSTAPFSNIVNSEQSHIDAWKGLLTKYQIAIPEDTFIGKVAAPASVKEACATGVAAEKEDVALYDRLMKTVKESDVLAVMQQQRDVSQNNHLPAFERCQ